jgi:hypothetical protein
MSLFRLAAELFVHGRFSKFVTFSQSPSFSVEHFHYPTAKLPCFDGPDRKLEYSYICWVRREGGRIYEMKRREEKRREEI